ncbi:MAG: hypothetical protein A3G34_14130 [Candidatus Lindowbacteria bacterium RIFCSPLOWO2_12_FULL_62_27]|nr:MAG: hypothetical protein A3I06_00485 [Candidatus Lindowbacteria bacterium RIFCSPLOWO2_02_FULL_62_12]OGH62704.1 MAG: hypothetical protein A3G34_14130 [Candidatus Lindowbacteria bacterium RIFCSPLOWO2_12_FULL_62_27]
MMAALDMDAVNVLVIGAGVYVCGRGMEGYGTVLPAVAECHRDGLIDRVTVAATAASSVRILRGKLEALNERLGTRLSVDGVPRAGTDPQAYREALSRGRFDAAIVVTPDATHFDLASHLIDAGVHCLVVKPLTPTVAEAVRLVHAAESKGVHGAVEFHKRWDEANLFLKSLVRDGRLGQLRYAAVAFSQKKMVPQTLFKSWAAQTNVFQYLGVHYADFLHFLTGALPVRAMAVGQKGWLAGRGIDTWDSIQAMVEWEEPSGNRFVSTFALNWIDPDSTTAMSDQKISLIGSAGRCDSDQKNRGLELALDGQPVSVPNPYFSSILPGPDGAPRFGGYGYRSIRQFIEDVATLKTGRLRPADLAACRPTFRAALPSTAVVEAVHHSLELQGEWVPAPRGDLEPAGRMK